MKLPDSLQSERGVSPVIGVILMVAITVILAAVIGSFVLGIGGDIEQAPQASLTIDSTDSGLELVHQGGDSIAYDNIKNADAIFVTSHSGESLDPGGSWDLTTPVDDPLKIVHNPSDKIIAELEV
ncbi:type IV pilin N-terminal domain-containing protein [Halodesulfurarchaeum sp. HSR-GB]|nr:type IV pilin N-terminal domain-containing protein [Halodesulfurarchaeum sp. HSR-GB]MDR5657730.1 type IV pilin N-terminal domain-containing protein [Halodesulfurarchaeum sp. HSR-GB]